MRPWSAYQATASAGSPLRSSARAWRSPGSRWRTFSSRVTTRSGWRSRSAASAPPGPTASSWRWSPTSTSDAPGAFDGEDEAGEVGVVGHPGFVDHHDGPVVEGDLAVVEAPQQRREGPRLDAGFGGRGCGRPGRSSRCRAPGSRPARGCVLAVSSAVVLPDPATPTTTDTPARPVQSCSTTRRCPAVSACPSRLLGRIHRGGDLVLGDGGAGPGGEAFDGLGDRRLCHQDLDRRVRLLPGAGHPDQRHHPVAADDAVEDPVELRRVPAVEAGRDLRDQVRAGEHLPVREQPTVDVEHLPNQDVDLRSDNRAGPGPPVGPPAGRPGPAARPA